MSASHVALMLQNAGFEAKESPDGTHVIVGVRGPVVELRPIVVEVDQAGQIVQRDPEEVWEPCQDLLRWKEAYRTLPMPFSACAAGHVDHLVRPHALTLGEQHQGRRP